MDYSESLNIDGSLPLSSAWKKRLVFTILLCVLLGGWQLIVLLQPPLPYIEAQDLDFSSFSDITNALAARLLAALHVLLGEGWTALEPFVS